MRCIAIPFEVNEQWIGGSYYIRNLVSAMKLLPTAEQAFILIVSDHKDSVQFILESGYNNIGWVSPREFEELAKSGNVDVIFPHSIANQETRTISWIPDFQELHLGYFFTTQEIANRRKHHRHRFTTAGLIVSSEDVAKDVELFYPGECQRIAVVHFSSFDQADFTKVDDVRCKYDLVERYVLCANQIWLHKNHITVIRAVALLKNRGIGVNVVFTGNEKDYRLADYSEFLKSLVIEWGIADRVRFLGFIPRDDQLCLMKGAHYILQPSLFEGWSTVIEDAKAMGKFVAASDLNVHKEQLMESCRFFSRSDPIALAELMAELSKIEEFPTRTIDYSENRTRFARDFMEAVQKFLPSNLNFVRNKSLNIIKDLSNRKFSEFKSYSTFDSTITNSEGVGFVESSRPIASPIKNLAPHNVPDYQIEIETNEPLIINLACGVFFIKIHKRNENFNVLTIINSNAVQTQLYYDEFAVKLTQVRDSFYLAVRLNGYTAPPKKMVSDDNQDGFNYIFTLPLQPSKNSGGLVGKIKKLCAISLNDVSTVLGAGIVHLRNNAINGLDSTPHGLRPIFEGINLTGNC